MYGFTCHREAAMARAYFLSAAFTNVVTGNTKVIPKSPAMQSDEEGKKASFRPEESLDGIPQPNNLTSYSYSSSSSSSSTSSTSWQLSHSSLAGLSSRGVMAGRPSPVALWDAVRLATVCRRTRTSRQSLSRLLHSLQAAEELRERVKPTDAAASEISAPSVYIGL
ncbi:hypothetical protein EYF80_030464 [Liparis tanakae]|uniref:Uncharacterized protein n=1 Tax=Liparis tanakae TaxID=230148 RepID=A0A4Z2H083_9TELE|nr:hypothetical protein EYF80_030464 [Liparis tanakae]